MQEENCEIRHKAIDGKFVMYNWVFGIIITLQLLTFGWLGYLGKEVMTMQVDYARTKSVLMEKLEYTIRAQEKLELKLDKIDAKLDCMANTIGQTKYRDRETK